MKGRLKDRDKVVLISKVYLDIYGPSTSEEIIKYIKECPIGVGGLLNPSSFGAIMRGVKGIKREKGKIKKYYVVK